MIRDVDEWLAERDPNEYLLLDNFCGEGGAGQGYHEAGWSVFGVDKSAERLKHYPFACAKADAIEFLLEHGHKFHAIHTSPTCTGYSAGTRAIPDRVAKYPRLIAAVREALRIVGRPYVIENVEGAIRELVTPALLCGRMAGLGAIDTDGTPLVMDRHRLFETDWLFLPPEHDKHDMSLQVAGSYGGARSDKNEARYERGGGYVPKDVEIHRALLGTPWMTKKGCQLSIPPVYTRFIGTQLLEHVQAQAAAS